MDGGARTDVGGSGDLLHGTRGQAFGRPALGNPSKYLLTNLALCGCCGGPLKVRSRSHGNGRKHFYGCAGYHERGRTVCANSADVPMVDADDIVIEALLDDVLDRRLLEESVDEALRLLQGDDPTDRIAAVEREFATVEQERSRLVAAIAAGGQLDGLLQALQARETRRRELEARRDGMRSERRLRASDADRVRDELLTLASSWRHVLADDPTHARPIVSSLLKGRVTITPTEARKRWTLSGDGSLVGLFERVVIAEGSFPSVWRPQRDTCRCMGTIRSGSNWPAARLSAPRDSEKCASHDVRFRSANYRAELGRGIAVIVFQRLHERHSLAPCRRSDTPAPHCGED